MPQCSGSNQCPDRHIRIGVGLFLKSCFLPSSPATGSHRSLQMKWGRSRDEEKTFLRGQKTTISIQGRKFLPSRGSSAESGSSTDQRSHMMNIWCNSDQIYCSTRFRLHQFNACYEQCQNKMNLGRAPWEKLHGLCHLESFTTYGKAK